MAPPSTKSVLSMTLMVSVAAASPAMFLIPKRPSVATVASYLLVASGLLSVAAGGVRLVSWRTTGHALQGWLGSAFVVLGVLILVTTGLSGFGVGSVGSVAPFDMLFNSLVAGFLVWRGITCERTGDGFSPLIALGCGVGVTLSAAALSIGLQTNGAMPAGVSTQPVRSLLYFLSGAVWVSLAVAARRLGPSLRRTALAIGLLSVGLLVRSSGSSSWDLTLAFSAPVFLGMSFAFGTALTHLDVELRSGSRLYRRLQEELDASRRKVETDRKVQEAWLHDLQNAVVALRASDAVLRSAPDGWAKARAAVADSVTAELAWIQTLVESARQLSPTDLDLETTLVPVVAAEQLLGARIELDVAGIAVLADRVALNRVVQNILTNARHYAPLSPVEIAAAAHDHCVEIAIRDHGPGIPPAERTAIFERGARGASSAGTIGSGLGLYVAQSLMDSLGGTIHVRDASPGCCFVIRVPSAREGNHAGSSTPRPLGAAAHLAPAV